MFAWVVIFVTVFLAIRMWSLQYYGDDINKIFSNGSDSGLHYVIDQYFIPFGRVCVRVIYAIYTGCTILNVTIFVLKYVPTGLYIYKLMTNIYKSSRERIRQKRMELDDIQLQIQIVNNKLYVRDEEHHERIKQLHRETERLQLLRARVRAIVNADESLTRTLKDASLWDNEGLINYQEKPGLDHELVVEILKAFTYENGTLTERAQVKQKCVDHVEAELDKASESSVYSSVSDMDVKLDYRVKISKLANVYKVTYLKNFIKQKKLRRAHKHALLKKKMESIINMLEDWKKSLDLLINNKLPILSVDSRVDVTSQEAMGDYSKPTLLSTDSNTELKSNDVPFDDYILSWAPNPCNIYYNFEESPETAVGQDFLEGQHFSDVKYSMQTVRSFERINRTSQNLDMVPEERISQVEIEEISATPHNM